MTAVRTFSMSTGTGSFDGDAGQHSPGTVFHEAGDGTGGAAASVGTQTMAAWTISTRSDDWAYTSPWFMVTRNNAPAFARRATARSRHLGGGGQISVRTAQSQRAPAY